MSTMASLKVNISPLHLVVVIIAFPVILETGKSRSCAVGQMAIFVALTCVNLDDVTGQGAR